MLQPVPGKMSDYPSYKKEGNQVSEQDTSVEEPLVVVSHNADGLNNKVKRRNLANAIRAKNADIVIVQEAGNLAGLTDFTTQHLNNEYDFTMDKAIGKDAARQQKFLDKYGHHWPFYTRKTGLIDFSLRKPFPWVTMQAISERGVLF